MVLHYYEREADTRFINEMNSNHKFQDIMKSLMRLHEKIVKISEFHLRGKIMKYRAVIKKVADWWIGWLINLPGVNAQERTESELIESLKIGAQEMLETEINFEPDAFMTTISIPDPNWAVNAKNL